MVVAANNATKLLAFLPSGSSATGTIYNNVCTPVTVRGADDSNNNANFIFQFKLYKFSASEFYRFLFFYFSFGI
ncbi:MAG: hypothetical protein A2Z20_02875 [Bdellovibrionales bacterium RBG_16_40_8]|nr:MAG: hypothetical protein A2Z20_02875 [Bdellovibrionales bacterium RBG_16_40_8]